MYISIFKSNIAIPSLSITIEREINNCPWLQSDSNVNPKGCGVVPKLIPKAFPTRSQHVISNPKNTWKTSIASSC